MTVQEAIKYVVKEVCEDCYGSDEPMGYCKTCGVKIALECMEEVEQYRALGTVEEIKKKIKTELPYMSLAQARFKSELDEYRNIGTVEELKEAREKQIPKKVQKLESKILIADGWQYQCPKCKCAVGINQHAEEQTQEDEYCPTCGKALKWGEEDV